MREGRGLSFRSELPTQPEGLGLHRLSLEEPYLQGSLPQEFTQMQMLERGPQGRNRQSSGRESRERALGEGGSGYQ